MFLLFVLMYTLYVV